VPIDWIAVAVPALRCGLDASMQVPYRSVNSTGSNGEIGGTTKLKLIANKSARSHRPNSFFIMYYF